MIQVKFKNLERSELARDIVNERLARIFDKFEDLKKSRVQVTLEMQNSPTQAGPDLLKARVNVFRGRYDGVVLEKANPSLYVALADLSEHMLEVLNRIGDRRRVKSRRQARQCATRANIVKTGAKSPRGLPPDRTMTD